MAAVESRLEANAETNSAAFRDADTWLRTQADRPITRRLWTGGAWGALHAALLNVTAAAARPARASVVGFVVVATLADAPI